MDLGIVINEFEQVTKYPLKAFLRKYADFMTGGYAEIRDYFSGRTVEISNESVSALRDLTVECRDVLAQFKNFTNKFSTCGYWELMDYIDNLNNTLEKINKLPKFLRTSLGKRGYTPSVQVSATVGSERTVDDVASTARELNQDNTQWVDLMLQNDWNEDDWEIDKLRSVNVFINNRTQIVVTTIIDQPIGDRVYGTDILRKISFADNDLALAVRKDNIEQKSVILLELVRGDVPENMLFGKNPMFFGSNAPIVNYSEVVTDIVNCFMQNDLFASVNVTDISFANGEATMKVEIQTKYDYKTEKTIVL